MLIMLHVLKRRANRRYNTIVSAVSYRWTSTRHKHMHHVIIYILTILQLIVPIWSNIAMRHAKRSNYFELSAMNGCVYARHNLGCGEVRAGNYHRAKKQFILAAKPGYKKPLDNVKAGFMHGMVTKDEYANTLHAYQDCCNEMKSDARDKARTLT